MPKLDLTLIATARAAQILRCGPENVRRLVKAGQLPVCAVVGNGERLFDLEEVQRLAAHRAAANHPVGDRT